MGKNRAQALWGTRDRRRSTEEPGAGKLCAAGRGAESVTQSREVRRETSGPSVLPEGESQRGQEHGGKARDTGRRHKGRLARPARSGESETASIPIPSGGTAHPLLTTLITQRHQERTVRVLRCVPSARWAMENDSIEGDEGDPYVALDTFSPTGTRDCLRGASPRATESS